MILRRIRVDTRTKFDEADETEAFGTARSSPLLVPARPRLDRTASVNALSFHLEHVHWESSRCNRAIPVGPNAIHLIALDTVNGHQWPS